MRARKWILFVLVLALVLGIGCVAASATQQPVLTQPHREQIPFRVNPAYEGIYDADDLAPLIAAAREQTQDGKVSHQMPTVQSPPGDYLSVEQAGLQLRQKLKERQSYIEVLVASASTDYNALVAEVVNVALAHTGDPVEGDYLLWHFGGWEGEVEWEQADGTYLYKYELMMLYYTSASQEQTLDTEVDNLLDSLGLDGKTDYQKVHTIYDYICRNISYDYLHLSDGAYTLKNSAYAALVNKSAVCQGYANLFYRLLLEEGIDCRIIAGDAGGPHAWNIVKLGEVYYNLDSTWDAGSDTWEYFLQNSEGFADHYRYLDYATTQFHTDYPMSATDYADGVEGVPENVYVAGVCGDDAFWTLGRDRVLTIVGTGKTDDYQSGDSQTGRPEWEYWEGAFDTVVVEEGITGLGSCLFDMNTSIVAVNLPASLETIGAYTFAGCVNLPQITLNEGLAEIGAWAFQQCNGLVSVTVPASVSLVGRSAFSECKGLQSVVISGDSVLGTSAFDQCKNLKEVVINGSGEIGSGAFDSCQKLEKVELNGDTQTIQTFAFYKCHALKEIILPETITELHNHCFSGCTGLQEIHFTGDEPFIGYYVFTDVTATAYYPMNNPTWGDVFQQELDGNITWKPYCAHDYESASTASSCIHNSETVYTCKLCGDTYTEIFRYATGQHVFSNDQDTICDVCGGKRDLNMPTTPMYRLYNKNSGEHFYTGSVQERDVLISVGWLYEGIAWNAPTKHGAPVYRLYNPNNGDHHYTMSTQERDMLVAVGWQYEGVAWNSASSGNIPMYRLYNPNADCGSHHYTGSEEERDHLVSLGWQYEGIGWYGLLN